MLLSDARQPEMGFLHLWAVVLPNVWHRFFIRERQISSTILVAFMHVKWEKASLLVDGHRSKRLCLSSLLSVLQITFRLLPIIFVTDSER